MGRLLALFIFCAIGFSMGFLTFLASPTFYESIKSLVYNKTLNGMLMGAIVTGIAGSITTLYVIIRWSRT